MGHKMPGNSGSHAMILCMLQVHETNCNPGLGQTLISRLHASFNLSHVHVPELFIVSKQAAFDRSCHMHTSGPAKMQVHEPKHI